MLRKAFVMTLNPGAEQEYIRRHDPIWTELEAVLVGHGVLTYSIFYLSNTHQLFAYLEIGDESLWSAIADSAVCQRWWRYMAELMPHNVDYSPQTVDLPEVFHLTGDRGAG